jgi:alcohol dehydrogenase YqhD (iron-dependent ADH family)
MNFELHTPTPIIFGAGTFARLGDVASRRCTQALLVTGGGSTMDAAEMFAAVALPWARRTSSRCFGRLCRKEGEWT